MRYIILAIMIFSFFGCSSRVKCNCKCPKPKAQEVVYKYTEPAIEVQAPAITIAPTRANESQVYYKKRVSYVREKAAPYWGEKAQVASKYNYVKYAKDFKARSIINFSNGVVRVETTDQVNPLRTLKEVIASTLLNTQNPENVDLFSSRHTIHVGEPFLYNRVKDHDGQQIRWQWRANRYAQHLIDTSLHKDRVKTTAGTKKRYYVTFDMKQEEYSKNSNLNYGSIVNEQARRFGLDPALIFALIETESHFNPMATSAIPAYGLMQVVPHSAGRDAWEFLTKHKGQPTRNYLFNAKNNIEMGSAYVHILLNRYLSKVTNPKSRELCAIAAYNTGSGNVLRSFHKNKKTALAQINRLSPEAIYQHLKKKLPYKETRDYIVKVTKAKKRYL